MNDKMFVEQPRLHRSVKYCCGIANICFVIAVGELNRGEWSAECKLSSFMHIPVCSLGSRLINMNQGDGN